MLIIIPSSNTHFLNISPVQKNRKKTAIYPVLKYWTLLLVIFSPINPLAPGNFCDFERFFVSKQSIGCL